MRQIKYLAHPLLVLAALMSFSMAAHAQKIKVRKIQGNKAIVEFTGTLTPGTTYELISPDEFGEESSANNRKYLVGLSFNLGNVKSDAANSVNVTQIDLSTRFGWNFGTFELGPVFSYNSTIASATATTFKIGAFGDYNMISNIPGEAFLYGLGVIGDFGQHDPGSTTVVDDFKYDLFEVFVGPFVKWFPTGGPYGFRLDAGYIYQRQSSTTLGTTTVSGFSSSLGIFAYF
ncbi:hypothetical protein [Bdellovibrio svalbardensis]|uniref:Outer membrane protein beta-barrel domain-containing protein n=1 Tax=Bdellovibrio svalbardensis TaxID=2972972 RepID=A0ABT6DH14_9BACT|nr:hypothetical protein [Bdellovibrio svalbardensis]MDG0816145.1 hypothetical protein [Bdellovibrio svalbardensis]